MRERLRLIRKELGLTQEALAQKLGIGKSALSMIETGRASLSERNKNIIVQELNVNPEWLETGQGQMFFEQRPEAVFTNRTDRRLPTQSVPLYNIEGTAGWCRFSWDRESVRPVDYIHIPNLPRCDGAIYVVGDSMYPLLKSGDIVLYKQVSRHREHLLGGHVPALDRYRRREYVTVKYIQKSENEGCVKLVSQNPHHADKEVPVERIRALAFVKASIRMNSIR